MVKAQGRVFPPSLLAPLPLQEGVEGERKRVITEGLAEPSPFLPGQPEQEDG